VVNAATCASAASNRAASTTAAVRSNGGAVGGLCSYLPISFIFFVTSISVFSCVYMTSYFLLTFAWKVARF
jgi:hypothetical protein